MRAIWLKHSQRANQRAAQLDGMAAIVHMITRADPETGRTVCVITQDILVKNGFGARATSVNAAVPLLRGDLP